MSRRITLRIAGWTLALALTPIGALTAPAGEPSPPFCYRNARNAFYACSIDANEEFWETRAGCINLATETERRACRAGTTAGRLDARAECQDQRDAREELCDQLGGRRYLPDFDPASFQDPDEILITNPFLDLTPGATRVLSGDDGAELVVILVTDRIKDVAGVACRTVVDIAVEVAGGEEKGPVEYLPLEVTDDWFAPHANGDVWYCGELSRNYEDGELADLDGSFEAGVELALPGLLIPANPTIGQVYRQEMATSEAEDWAEVISVNATPADEVPGFECNGNCLQTSEASPLEPAVRENKFYLPGVGFVLAVGFEDDEHDGREELVCAGASLDVLATAACDIADVAQLTELLCGLSADFCAEPASRD